MSTSEAPTYEEWADILEKARGASLGLSEDEPVAQGRLSSTLEEMGNPRNRASAWIDGAVSAGLLDKDAEAFPPAYTLAENRPESRDDETPVEVEKADTGEPGRSENSCCSGEHEILGLEGGVIPNSMKRREQWHTWKPASDGRKIPRAPYETGDDKWVSAHNPEIWTTHAKAAKWAGHLQGYGLAFDLPPHEHDPEHVLIDFDYARDDETGEVPPCVAEFVREAGTYGDVSTSGTGVHLLGRGRLPEKVKTIDDVFCEEHGVDIEVYDNKRFIAMTGKHIACTPDGCRDVTELLGELSEKYATETVHAPDGMVKGPERTREEIGTVDTTDDMQDVFDAIQYVRPSDIRLRSPATNERSGGVSRDPSWSSSESGTRLWEDGDGWVYRKGMHALDALQVVALEEGIITSETDYPQGEKWHEAVDALRDRGAHIPEYTGKRTPTKEALGLDKEAESQEEKIQQFLAELKLSDA